MNNRTVARGAGLIKDAESMLSQCGQCYQSVERRPLNLRSVKGQRMHYCCLFSMATVTTIRLTKKFHHYTFKACYSLQGGMFPKTWTTWTSTGADFGAGQ